jgi:hypothetical protein
MAMVFVGACDRFRKTPEGESAWQEMMATREEITEAEFLASCDVADVLDEDETWEQYKEAWRSDPIRYYKSANGMYHFQTAGFEHIWR